MVNCGTYAYQCRERGYFRSTQAHNTVQIDETEQSEVWSTFRLARRSRTRVLKLWNNGIRMEMQDYKGNRIQREIRLSPDNLRILDTSSDGTLMSHLHCIPKLEIRSNVPLSRSEALYAPEYGKLRTIDKITAAGKDSVELEILIS